MSKKKPTVLMILDGYGLNDKVEGNAVKQANTPVMDDLMANCPFVEGQASGMAICRDWCAYFSEVYDDILHSIELILNGF